MKLELNSKEPIYIQIENYIKMKIISGELKRGERLLSVRDYAAKLRVNPNTISRVYSDLESENLIITQRGIGKFVTENTDVINNLHYNLSRSVIKEFVIKSKDLGLSKNQLFELLTEMYEEV